MKEKQQIDQTAVTAIAAALQGNPEIHVLPGHELAVIDPVNQDLNRSADQTTLKPATDSATAPAEQTLVKTETEKPQKCKTCKKLITSTLHKHQWSYQIQEREERRRKRRAEAKLASIWDPLILPECIPEYTPKLVHLATNDRTWIQYLVAAFKTHNSEIPIRWTPQGIDVTALDSSRVSMLHIILPADNLPEYSTNQPSLSTCLDTNEVEEILKRLVKGDAEISLNLNEVENKHAFKFTFKGRRTREFTVLTTESIPEDLPEPKVTYKVRATLIRSALLSALTDIDLKADHVKFKTESTLLELSGDGEKGEAKVSFPKGDPDLLNLEVQEPSKSAYNLDSLMPIIKAIATDTVVLEYSSNLPLRLTFEAESATFYYWLAPRMMEA